MVRSNNCRISSYIRLVSVTRKAAAYIKHLSPVTMTASSTCHYRRTTTSTTTTATREVITGRRSSSTSGDMQYCRRLSTQYLHRVMNCNVFSNAVYRNSRWRQLRVATLQSTNSNESLGAKISGGRGRPWGIFFGFYKTRHILLSDSANSTVLRAVVLTQYRRVTDRRTDRRNCYS